MTFFSKIGSTFSILLFGQSCISTHDLASLHRLKGFREAQEYVYKSKNTLNTLSKPGFSKIKIVKKYSIPLSPNFVIESDLFIPRHQNTSPLVILVHGNKFNKTLHFNQAKHLASWGFYAMTIQVPNKNQWLQNGERIAYLVKHINSFPRMISKKFREGNIILAGHSFGGSAVILANKFQIKIRGLILLDPALVHKKVIDQLKKSTTPTILLGADSKVFRSRKRWAFFKFSSAPIYEVSVKGATHNDAQSPSMAQERWGFDFDVNQSKQLIFKTLITQSAFNLLDKDPIKMSNKTLAEWIKNGNLIKARYKY